MLLYYFELKNTRSYDWLQMAMHADYIKHQSWTLLVFLIPLENKKKGKTRKVLKVLAISLFSENYEGSYNSQGR